MKHRKRRQSGHAHRLALRIRSSEGEEGEVFKIQLPQGGEMTMALAYNADHSTELLLEITPGLREAIPDGVKAYWFCRDRPDALEFIRPAPSQEW